MITLGHSKISNNMRLVGFHPWMAFSLFLEGVFESGGCVLLMILYQNLGTFIKESSKSVWSIKEKFTKRDQHSCIIIRIKNFLKRSNHHFSSGWGLISQLA